MEMKEVFLVILGGSFLFFVISTVFGMEHGDVDGHDHGDGDGEGGFMTDLFTLRNLFLFGVGFGAIGFIARYLGAGPLGSSFAGIGAGVLMAMFGAWLFRALRNQQANSIVDLETVVGKTASVITAIPEGGRGEISTTNSHGARVTMPAQSSGGAVSEQTPVKVTSVVGNTAIVEAL